MSRGLSGTVCLLIALAVCSPPAWARSARDLPDDTPDGPQIHVIYALPQDGAPLDRGLDVNGQLVRETVVWQRWLLDQTGGRGFRLDLHNGALDVSGVTLSRRVAQLRRRGIALNGLIAEEIAKRGFNRFDRIYVVYYDGPVDPVGPLVRCGSASEYDGPTRPAVALVTPRAVQTAGAGPCAAHPLAASANQPPGFLQYTAVHQIIHSLGFVPTCAPHHSAYDGEGSHVRDDPRDVMFRSGPAAGAQFLLDPGRDDYYGHGRTNCPDLNSIGWLTGPGGTPSALRFVRTYITAVKRPRRVRRGRRYKIKARVLAMTGSPAGGICVLRRGRVTRGEERRRRGTYVVEVIQRKPPSYDKRGALCVFKLGAQRRPRLNKYLIRFDGKGSFTDSNAVHRSVRVVR